MWSSWTEKATKGLAEASEKATKSFSEASEKAKEALELAEKQAAKSARGLTDALERTGDVITKAATQPKAKEQESQSEEPSSSARNVNTDDSDDGEATTEQQQQARGGVGVPKINVDGAQVLQNLQMGWSSVVESTRRTVEATKEAVDMERTRLETNFLGKKGFYKRDLRLPLDVDALRDAEVVYITDRIITMSHPAMASSVIPSITAERKLAAVAHLLESRHEGRFLVWNLSEVEYDISILNDQVLTFSFPGSPSPPLGLLLKLLVSMENWMKADKRNIAVVHCLTGKGRTSTVLGAFLCWMGEAGFGDMNEALEYIARCKQIRPGDLTIPSQRRYASYFKNMLDGVRPSQPPLVLKRIIMSEAPKFAKGPPRDDIEVEEGEDAEEKLMGCAPYLQIFKAGKLIFTTAAKLHVQQGEEELPFVQKIDGTVPFNVEEVIQGDILIRCRHLTFKKQRISMFRAAFHTGYVPPNVLRLDKSQLDGACTDKRFPDDFFLDLIFEKADAETATKHLEEQEAEEQGAAEEPKGKGPVVTASGFDAMLQGDSRFWDVIAQKKEEHVQNKSDDPMVGPTVGRRRGDSTKNGKAHDDEQSDNNNTTKAPKQRTSLETFSIGIGNEFDFLPTMESTSASPAEPQRKDDLMEALDALDEDHDFHGTEEVVFDSGPTPVTTNPPSEETKPAGVVAETMNVSDENEKDKGEAATETTTAPEEPVSESVPSEPNIDDMDALLASADDDFGDFGDLDLDGLDDDDDDIEDLENFLKT